jgi:ligand-binding SRPBCC domain-containing protein
MGTTFHLRVWTRFLAPVEDVWRLKTDPEALAAEFLPYVSFRVDDAESYVRAFAEGRAVEAAGRLCPRGWPVGVRWPMRLESVDPGTSYRDSSTNRLYTRFEHTHLFEPTPDGCRYVDAVTFTPALPAQKLAAILTRRFFVHRHRVAAGRLRADQQATGTSVLRVLVEQDWDAPA